jgi:hypothetical protein
VVVAEIIVYPSGTNVISASEAYFSADLDFFDRYGRWKNIRDGQDL